MQRPTLGLASVPGLGRDCVCTDAFRGRRVTGTVYCTDGTDMTFGSHEAGCAPEMHRALENSRHTTSPHICTPINKQITLQSITAITDSMEIIVKVTICNTHTYIFGFCLTNQLFRSHFRLGLVPNKSFGSKNFYRPDAPFCHTDNGIKALLYICLYRARQKKSNPLGKIRYLRNCRNFFSPNLQSLQRRIQATYPANFIGIFGCIRKL